MRSSGERRRNAITSRRVRLLTVSRVHGSRGRVCRAFIGVGKHGAFVSYADLEYLMRAARSVAAASIALTAVLLAGCTADAPAPVVEESTAPADLCALAAPSGTAAEAVTVEGQFGVPASVTFPAPMSIASVERAVTTEGDGEQLDASSLVDYAMSVFDAATGQQLQEQGYSNQSSLPVPAVTVGQFLGCATVGSRITVAVPETDEGGATVWVLDVLDASPGRATGVDQDPVDGLPEVTLAESGAPTVTIPSAAPPADNEVAVLKKGDGATVVPGDSVMVHYTGVRWSDGTTFDSSWDKGAPTALVTTDVIPGYRPALEEQTVGSQVLVVIPPEMGYGEGQINEEDLVGETLVFVVDILGTQPAA